MSHISLKGNSYKYCTCDAVGPVPSFLLTAQRAFKVGGVDETGPKRRETRRLVFFISSLFYCY